MKIKIKRYLEVTYSFRKLFSQSFGVLIQRGDVINPKLAQKRTQTDISCTNDDRKMVKNNFEVMYLFMKLFSQNREILAPCCDVIKKTQICISCLNQEL